MINNINILCRLLKLFRPYWAWMLLGVCLSLMTILANVSLLALAGWFITMMAIAGAAGTTEVNYFTPAAAIRGFAITRTAGRYAERLVTHEATFRLLASLRVWFYQHLEPLAPAVLQHYHSGDLLSRIRADIDHLENFYLRILAPIIVAIIACVFFALFLHQYNDILLLVEMSLLFIAGVLVPILINRQAKHSGERLITCKSDLRVTTSDSVQGMGELLIYGAADTQAGKISQLTEDLLQDQEKQASLYGISQAAMLFCANLAMWSMLLLSIPLLKEQQISAANIPMLALFALASFEAIAPLPLALQLLPETLKSAKRIFEIVDKKPLIKEPKTASPKPENFDIEFKQVSFHYDEKQGNVLSSLNFKLPQGNKLAIIGESGAGKTSVMHLLLRLWPITSGEITLGGHSLEHFHSDDSRQYFSVVSQQTLLFNSTIKRNLLLANNNANDDEIEQACRTAQIHDFIISQPQGYDTWIGEAGLKLSGGQSRRIATARALLKNTPILILDEPGEGLDTITEKKMLNAIFDDNPDISILMITHRKIGLERMDKIICLEKLD